MLDLNVSFLVRLLKKIKSKSARVISRVQSSRTIFELHFEHMVPLIHDVIFVLRQLKSEERFRPVS